MISPSSDQYFTSDILIAAYLKASGYEATIQPTNDPGFFTFCFEGEKDEFERLSAEFLSGGSIPALKYNSALNELRGALRRMKGGVR